MLPFKDFVNTARRVTRNIRGAIAENINEKINETIELAENILTGERSLQRAPIRLEEEEVSSPFQRRDGGKRQFSTLNGPFSSSNARIREFSSYAWREHCKEQRQKSQRRKGSNRFAGFNDQQRRYYSYNSYSNASYNSSKCVHKRGVTFAVRTLVLQADPFTLGCHSRKAPKGLYSHFASLRVRMFSTTDIVGPFRGVNVLDPIPTAAKYLQYAPFYRLCPQKSNKHGKLLSNENVHVEEPVHTVPGCTVEFYIDQNVPTTSGMLDTDTIRALKDAYVAGPALTFKEMDLLKEKLGSPPLETYSTPSGRIVFCMKFPDCDASKMESILRENSITTAVVKSIDDSYSSDEEYMSAREITEEVDTSSNAGSATSSFSSYCGLDISDCSDVSGSDTSRRSSISLSSIRSSELDIYDVLSSGASELTAFNHLTINSVFSEGTFTNNSEDDLLHLDFNEAVSYH